MYLNEIIENKRKELENFKVLDFQRSRDHYNAVQSLKEKPFIAEVKKASPSMGDINTCIDIENQALEYQKGGAGAISVLTDTRYFKGTIKDLFRIANEVTIPVLCKDFIIDERQIENAHRAGADLILLIAAVLTEDELASLSRKAEEKNMKVLFEIHDLEEFNKLSECNLDLVGVNSRDLKTFKIDLEKAKETIANLKGDFLKIAESGIDNIESIKEFRKAGADGFLIGTALMKAEDPVEKLKSFNGAL